MEKVTWTHKNVEITDIRKVKKFYIITIKDDNIKSPLFVDHNIFDTRVSSFLLKEVFERYEILPLRWNMIITKGFFYKVDKDSVFGKIEKDPEKYYISFLEIDGPLGTHVPG